MMNSIKEELPEDQNQSSIVNEDAVFENSSVDPGFVFEETSQDGDEANDQPKGVQQADEKDEQGTELGSPGLGELDGTNPGSNHHPIDS